ncbi:MAG: hypothetical protein P1S46_04065 [bacterium]|nr:hypothetical protein [bacterium]MDT8395645.1 hypothetical protein [bacterium]
MRKVFTVIIALGVLPAVRPALQQAQARYRKDRPSSREPRYFEILPFEADGRSLTD